MEESVTVSWSPVLNIFYNSTLEISQIKEELYQNNNSFIKHYKGVIISTLNRITKNYQKVDCFTHIVFRNTAGLAFVLKNADREYTLPGKKLVIDLDIINQNKNRCNGFVTSIIIVTLLISSIYINNSSLLNSSILNFRYPYM